MNWHRNLAFPFARYSMILGLNSGLSDLYKTGREQNLLEDYKPYANSLTPMEVAALHELYDWTEGIHKKVLFQVLRKYGPDKLQL